MGSQGGLSSVFTAPQGAPVARPRVMTPIAALIADVITQPMGMFRRLELPGVEMARTLKMKIGGKIKVLFSHLVCLFSALPVTIPESAAFPGSLEQ